MVFEFGGELRYISIDDGTVHSIIELIHIYLISRDSKREKSNLLKSFKLISLSKNQE